MISNKKVNFLNKIYIVLAVFSFAVFAITYTIFLPTVKEIKFLNKEIINQKIELEKKINQEKNKVELIDNIKKIEPEIDLLDNVFLDSNKELEFITTLEGVANKHNVKQTLDLVFQKQQKTSTHKIIPLNINIEGRYFDTLEYLKNLESLDYYINIKNLNISFQDNIKTDTTANYPNQQSARLTVEAETFWK